MREGRKKACWLLVVVTRLCANEVCLVDEKEV